MAGRAKQNAEIAKNRIEKFKPGEPEQAGDLSALRFSRSHGLRSGAGRTAVSVGGETDAGEDDRSEVDRLIAHRKWGNDRSRNGRCAVLALAGGAAIHGALGVTLARRKAGGRLGLSIAMVVMMVHRAIAIRHGSCMAGNCLACSRACRRQQRRRHRGKQGQHRRDRQEAPHD
jgi:hypothetical protein